MKRNMSIFLCLMLVAAMAALAQSPAASAPPTSAPAAAPAPTKIGIINVQQAIVQSNEGQRDFKVLSDKFAPKQTELQKLNTEIQDLKKQLDTQSDKLNDQARSEMARNLDQKQKLLQRNGEDYQNEYQQESNQIAQKILEKMGPVIDKYATENQYSLIIDVSQPWPQGEVLWAGKSVDITTAVVNIYNAQSGVAAPPASATKPGAAATQRPGAPSATRPAPSASKPAPKPPGE